MLMVDSGAFIHVRPPSFMAELHLRQVRKPPDALVAVGAPLKLFGMRRCESETYKGIRLTIDLCAMNVSCPILSAGALVAKGYPV
eukprot:5424079-Heterocapsa_arctica.AAC.1